MKLKFDMSDEKSSEKDSNSKQIAAESLDKNKIIDQKQNFSS